ncbi:unnamed protein product [Allacma fusca]|uniref:Uncharacterized protein n=1 Tax=Allacma fusca TaxID=39272 RepID=A0A8J2Q4F7_9HEXA|nr:unnamed protein product [Allacma fusca]
MLLVQWIKCPYKKASYPELGIEMVPTEVVFNVKGASNRRSAISLTASGQLYSLWMMTLVTLRNCSLPSAFCSWCSPATMVTNSGSIS